MQNDLYMIPTNFALLSQLMQIMVWLIGTKFKIENDYEFYYNKRCFKKNGHFYPNSEVL